MKFPSDYPYSPPSIRFLTKVWHPNVYEVSVISFIKPRNVQPSYKEWQLLHIQTRTAICAYQFCIRPSTIRRVVSCPANDGTQHRTCAQSCCRSSRCWTSRTHIRQPTSTHPLCTEDGATRTARTTSIPTLLGTIGNNIFATYQN